MYLIDYVGIGRFATPCINKGKDQYLPGMNQRKGHHGNNILIRTASEITQIIINCRNI